MKRYSKTIFCILLLCVVALSVPRYNAIVSQVTQLAAADTIVIDAGHGGMDGGASSAAGVSEKDINLAIAREIQNLAEADGWRVVMTRDDDRLLGRQEGSIRNKKTQDLKARKEIIDKQAPLVAVSIHLNSFKEDPRVRGAQVFYPAGPGEKDVLGECKLLAEKIQAELIAGINDGTERTALSRNGVLIFKNPKTPTVIAECGFLSNREEAALLGQEEYQRRLAQAIYDGIMAYTGKTPTQNVEIIDSVINQRGVKINSEQTVDK